jgi:hypothetical protein
VRKLIQFYDLEKHFVGSYTWHQGWQPKNGQIFYIEEEGVNNYYFIVPSINKTCSIDKKQANRFIRVIDVSELLESTEF